MNLAVDLLNLVSVLFSLHFLPMIYYMGPNVTNVVHAMLFNFPMVYFLPPALEIFFSSK